MDFFATAPKGLEGLLADELRALGAADAHERRAGCAFTGDLALAYRVCLWSRVASRVLLPLVRFPAADPDQLYEGVRSIPWEDHLEPEGTLAVDVATRGSSNVHTHYAALRVKDAVVDQFRERLGVRPSVDVHRPSLRLNVLLDREEALLSVDLSGESLHRRAYRREGEQAEAPMKENLAAAVLLRSGWPDIAAAGGALLDPMCGSGTLLIEGALMAGDVAPGLLRGYFGFLGWKHHDPAAWTAERDHAEERRAAGRAGLRPVTGYDVDGRSAASRGRERRPGGSSERSCVSNAWMWRRRSRRDSPTSCLRSCPGLVVANPPYGTRLGEAVALAGPLSHPGFSAERGVLRLAIRAAHGRSGTVLGHGAACAAHLFAVQRGTAGQALHVRARRDRADRRRGSETRLSKPRRRRRPSRRPPLLRVGRRPPPRPPLASSPRAALAGC